jgi:hypothetical protein
VPTCSPSSSCHPSSLPSFGAACMAGFNVTFPLLSLSSTDTIKLADVDTHRLIEFPLFGHAINQIPTSHAGAVTCKAQRVNSAIKTSIASRYRGEADGWEACLGARALNSVMCRRASFALPSNRGRIDEHASTTSALCHQHSTASISPRPLAHHVSPAPTLVYHPITVADTTTTLSDQVK